MNKIKLIIKGIFHWMILFIIYGIIYFVIETLWKQSITNYRMFILGGVLGVSIGAINNLFTYETNFILQCLFGCLLVTLCEGILGYQWDVIEGLKIWDYSSLPYSAISGQVNLFFSFAWFILSGICIVIDDKLRQLLFNEKIGNYKWL